MNIPTWMINFFLFSFFLLIYLVVNMYKDLNKKDKYTNHLVDIIIKHLSNKDV